MTTTLRSCAFSALIFLASVRGLLAQQPIDDAEMQQRLRNAVNEYQEAVTKAKSRLSEIIDRLMRESASKGDLEKAQQYRAAQTDLSRGSPLPDLPGLKVGSTNYTTAIARAKATCEREFDEVIKQYTKAVQLDTAAKLRREKAAVFARKAMSVPAIMPDRVSKAIGRYRDNVSLFFSFDDDELGRVADSSSFGNDGVSHEGRTEEDPRRGKTLGLGVGSYIEVPSSPSLNPRAITIAAWIRPTSQGGNVVSKDDWDKSAPKGYVLRVMPNGIADFTVGGSQWRSCVSPAGIPLNTWTHLAATCDGATIRLYVNGMPVSGAVLQGQVALSPLPLNIGWCPFDKIRERKFEGMLDDVLILNTAAPPETIAKLFEMSK
jgi:hypothetical protein